MRDDPARHPGVRPPPKGISMTQYVVMFPGDNEEERAARTEAERQAVFDTDFEFGQLLDARGGAVTGGAGLTLSSEPRTSKRGPNSNVLVTDGPYTESAEQLSGFFIVTCDDYDALVEAAQSL